MVLADPVVIAVAGPLERRVVRVHLGDRELGRRIDIRECLSIDDNVANHEPDFDVVGTDVQAAARDGMAFPENDASRTFNPLGEVCHATWLFGNRDHATSPAFGAEHGDGAQVRPDINASQAIRLAMRTTRHQRRGRGRLRHGGQILRMPIVVFCHLHDKRLKSEGTVPAEVQYDLDFDPRRYV